MQTLKKFYFGKSKFIPFVSTWKTDNLSTGSSTATQVKLPLISTGSYNFIVDWGDGTQNTITTWNQAQVTKTYSVAGTYQITIKGKCIGWVFNNTGDRLKILSIQQWGNFNSGSNGAVFFGCSNLSLASVSDLLNVSVGNTILQNWFNGCTNITTINRISEWDLSMVISIAAMFTNSKFDQNIGNWNVSNIGSFADAFNGSWFNNGGSSDINNWALKNTGTIDFTRVFALNTKFNQPIGNWNTSRVNNCAQMFQGATIFNQTISSWNTSNVTNMSSMFFNATNFNNGLASEIAGDMLWNLSSVTTTNSMFNGATSFNQNLGVLNLPLCTNFTSMFQNASKFNNGGSTDINGWTLATTGNINFTNMFSGAVLFNQPIGSWNTSRVTNMTSMFGAIASVGTFNQDISSWNVSNVTTMFQMFLNNRSFNQPIGIWNTSSVTNMGEMFRNTAPSGTSSFNKPIGSWDVSKVTRVDGMFQYSGSFNQNLSGWNLAVCSNFKSMFNLSASYNNGGVPNTWTLSSTVAIDMSSMFNQSTAFNQDIGSWNVSSVTGFTNFMLGKTPATFSATNLDAIYNGWSTRPVKTPITITFGTAKYTAAGAAGRAILTGAPNNWVITDGGI